MDSDGDGDQIDAEYRGKYPRYAASIIDHVTSPQARAATLKLVPCPPFGGLAGNRPDSMRT